MRSLAAGNYTAPQVDQVLRSDSWIPKRRFDVVDLDGNLRPDIPIEATAASVSWQASRAIKKQLQLQLRPQPALLRAPYRYFIKPYYGVGPMYDGGYAWLVQGSYLWTTPVRDIRAISADPTQDNPDIWSLTIGDRQSRLDAEGPGLQGVLFSQGMLFTDAIKQLLARVGITNFSGIKPGPAALVDALTYTLQTGASTAHTLSPGEWAQAQQIYEIQKYLIAVGRWTHTYSGPDAVPPVGVITGQQTQQPQTLGAILDLLHHSIGYDPGFFDQDDVWQANPTVDLSKASANISYTAERLDPASVAQIPPYQRVALLLNNPQVTPDVSQIANRVIVESTASQGPKQLGIADLNDFIPNHPLAQRQIRFYQDSTINNSTSQTADSLSAQALTSLFAKITAYEQVHIETAPYPAHTGYDIVGLTIPQDLEYGTQQLTAELGWNFDMFAHRVRRDLRRLYL